MIKTALMASPFEVCEDGTRFEPVGGLNSYSLIGSAAVPGRLRRVVLVESSLFVARIDHATANKPRHTAGEELTRAARVSMGRTA
jgi:hypothetical protein